MSEFFKALMEWVEKTVPSALAVGTWVYGYMQSKLRKEENAHDKTKLEKEMVENELSNERDYAGKSDSDIIKAASTKPSVNS